MTATDSASDANALELAPVQYMAYLIPASDANALELAPVQYMALVLNRAKGWLAEAQSIEQVRETRAIAVGYESVIREKELAFDAQLSATEIVRRCERRIGELVREGQRDGTIAKRGSIGVGRGQHLRSPTEFFDDLTDERVAAYAMADAPAKQFEQAVTEAREEGNLSRVNVVRKVKGETPQESGRSEWHINRRHIDSNRILVSLAHELEAATSGLELMERDGLDPQVMEESVRSIKRSLTTIGRHVRRIQ